MKEEIDEIIIYNYKKKKILEGKAHFSNDQYLLGDLVYTPLIEIVSGYKKPPNGTLSANNVLFNQLHANLYVQTEHCIGILKSRFELLKGLHTSVYDKYNIEKIEYWIRCCCVLHNLLLDCGDDTFVEDSVRNTATSRNNERLESRTSSELGKNKRERIKQIIIQ
ncbi:hypothetical protein PHYBLDRAFT_63544 [Phycomyces blakesleeanus NRRL 1555(-)]|uniref:DDE Tnp4 domain-containing protein n=1 Tax=Phycomyces blakesleeanus (strain ATCC 8743b / DSM 1359 / FGSC 10004 / NBRC 33097 / NRRL 1555) TaxID=763407 RepID=A0A162TNE5_PHYB8|nr:hypothetical protein PHYBLDRAFT_63544 [Phycomyces blakesleeanus NRRL 1555(-)]OAD68543.1 hypothetical protein PHYBLDRAFT_63544 [Phycomyces blakesleeanus NRRL 1555(-)]|eukprot:XP_018286583.1 hypothetical protein PHYBLDRAFT_63544 [Phycomyces blakesleeanus NRRL 1555(-)]